MSSATRSSGIASCSPAALCAAMAAQSAAEAVEVGEGLLQVAARAGQGEDHLAIKLGGVEPRCDAGVEALIGRGARC